MMYNRNILKKLKICLVCHGNICRSPMAEFVMKDKLRERGLDKFVEVCSRATSYEETGNPVYPHAVAKMKSKGVTIEPHFATTLERCDYGKYDMFVGMDLNNVQRMRYTFSNDPERKVSKLLDYTDNPRDIADPWYNDDFDTCYDDIVEGVDALIGYIVREKLNC